MPFNLFPVRNTRPAPESRTIGLKAICFKSIPHETDIFTSQRMILRCSALDIFHFISCRLSTVPLLLGGTFCTSLSSAIEQMLFQLRANSDLKLLRYTRLFL